MKQGTVSVLIGCHSPIHSWYTLKAWRVLYGSWPCWWEVCCIFLHDIGHWGKQYLDDPEQKAEHWKLGAKVALVLFGDKGYYLVAGHCRYSSEIRSWLLKADKYSWLLAPYWWLWMNTVAEPKLMRNYPTRREAVISWLDDVQMWWAKKDVDMSLHDYYIAGIQDKGKGNNVKD